MTIHGIYNKEFIEETQRFESLLAGIKQRFDLFDKANHGQSEQIAFIEENRAEIFGELNDHFAKIWEIAQDFSKEELQRHQRYYQKALVPLLEVSPYNKRVYDKPLGYAGDYVMMLYLYEDRYEGDSTYAKLIHRYSLSLPAARANHNRKDFYKKHINDILAKADAPRIASVACGPAVEIIEALNENDKAKDAIFTCIDFEQLALNYIKEQVLLMEQKKATNFYISYLKANIHNLLRYDQLEALLDDQDLIYSSGLIDYCGDKIAAKLLEVLYKKLNPGGCLIVGNVSSEAQHRAYTELLGEWYINYRNEDDMIGLTGRIKDEGKKVEIRHEEETKMNIFLIISKP